MAPPFPARANAWTALNLFGVAHVKRRELDTKGLRHRTNRSELPDTCRRRRIAQYQCSRNLGRGLFQQFGPFSAHAIFEVRETRRIASRVRHVLHEARTDRIRNIHEHNWNSPRGLLQCADRDAANAQDYVGSERGKLRGVTAKAVDIATDLTAFDLKIAAALPTQLSEGFVKEF